MEGVKCGQIALLFFTGIIMAIKTLYAISLGCPKNLTDTEYVISMMKKENKGLSLVDDIDYADYILINTCAFIQEAVEESIDAILSAALQKKDNQTLIVMGCLYNRYGEQLRQELPEVDLFWTAHKAQEAQDRLKNTKVFYATPRWRAYVKVIEGCSNRCTYCLIPMIRGKARPRPFNDILAEVKYLEERGVKEVTFVGQDLTLWTEQAFGLEDLIKKLSATASIPWLRFLYLNPIRLNKGILSAMYEAPNVCNYLDLPVQHASDKILRMMGRGYDQKRLYDIFGLIKRDFPEFSLRTSVITGFPGETEKDFNTLLSFIREVEFDHLGCFAYSDEDKAHSYCFRDKVPSKTAKERRDRLLTIQNSISKSRLKRFVGKTMDVLIEGVSEETEFLLKGRSEFQAPEVDGIIYINEGSGIEGNIHRVQITDSFDYDLLGRITQ